MLNLHHILFADDMSTASDQALPFALHLAAETGARIHHVYAEILHGDVYPTEQPARSLDALLERAGDDRPDRTEHLDVTHETIRGLSAAQALLDYAREQQIDLIVMGTHGRRGPAHLLMGSVAEEVARQAPCPVLTVRQQEIPSVVWPVRSILVPIDFSDFSKDAIRNARALAGSFRARIDLLHVVDVRVHPFFYPAGIHSVYDVNPNFNDEVAAQLQEAWSATDGPDVPVQFHVRSGHAPQEILAFADAHRNDLIVMATHGLSGLERFFVGSVTEKVVRRAPCPIFTVRSFGKALLPPRKHMQ